MNNNPFETIDARLSNIENILLDIKHNPDEDKTSSNILEQLFTVQETADFLNLSVPTIYSKVSKGELPFMKRSKRLYFSRKELLEYLKEGRNKTNAEIEAETESYLANNKKG